MTSFSDILPCIVCNSLLLKGAPLLRYRTLLYLWIFGVSLYRLGWSYILLVHHQIRLSYRGDISHRFSYSPLYIVLLLVFIFFLPPLNYNFISLTSLKTSTSRQLLANPPSYCFREQANIQLWQPIHRSVSTTANLIHYSSYCINLFNDLVFLDKYILM